MCLLSFSLGALDHEKIRWCGSGLSEYIFYMFNEKTTKNFCRTVVKCKSNELRKKI